MEPDDGWGEFECVACGSLVYTLAVNINPEHRCAVCQFIFEAPTEIQDELRRHFNQGVS